ncbi:MAG: Flp pilus assembly complex ATPase component TadA [Anaerotruncus sp.]|nr:Flp pilus assembly complex ATPase component TadA [Anaerotruncus sp.]
MLKYNPILTQCNIQEYLSKMQQQPEQLVAQAEANYRQQITDVCDFIEREKRFMILVTGPSASGKTTTAQRLAQELRARGKRVNSISLDNFYKCAAELPRWKDGYQNYESIEGLDLPLFDEVVTSLLTNGRASFPLFDFSVRQRAEQRIDLEFDSQTYLIFEGIHALSPQISDVISNYPNMKIYISVHSDFTDADGKILLAARDLRLIRRILRDFTYRSTSADKTFEMWDYVTMGEELYIRPNRKYADWHIDSTHVYEPFLYHDEILHALDGTTPQSAYLPAIERLYQSASHFFGISPALIPQDSLIREFMKP